VTFVACMACLGASGQYESSIRISLYMNKDQEITLIEYLFGQRFVGHSDSYTLGILLTHGLWFGFQSPSFLLLYFVKEGRNTCNIHSPLDILA